MLSTENIEKFKQSKQPFIVGARLKNESKPLTLQILNTSDYQPLYQDHQQTDEITYKNIPKAEEGLRLIVTYSPKRAAKDKHDREKAIESLTKRMGKSQNPASLLNNFGYKKFIKLQGDAKLTIDELKLKEAEKWDGLHGIISNIETEDAKTLLHHYKGLWQVEETFRISKHDLRMRPVFHRTPKRINAHIALCFMALMCVRVMEYTVRLQYKKLSPAAIKNELMRLETSILKDHRTQKQYAMPGKASQDTKKIYQILGLKWNDTPYIIKDKASKG